MNLETYLKQATRGIWGKRKQDAILELRGNIEARIWTLEHQGKTQAEALEMALQELGDAREIRSGFVQLQFTPVFLRALILAGMAVWTTFSVTPIEARVQASPNFDIAGRVRGFEISTRSLQRALMLVSESEGTRFSVARAIGQSEPTVDLQQILQTICRDTSVTLEQNRDVITFSINGRPRWTLTLEVSQTVARAWHELHQIDSNSCS